MYLNLKLPLITGLQCVIIFLVAFPNNSTPQRKDGRIERVRPVLWRIGGNTKGRQGALKSPSTINKQVK